MDANWRDARSWSVLHQVVRSVTAAALVLCMGSNVVARAAGSQSGPEGIAGTVTTQAAAVALAGVQVVVRDGATKRVVARTVSDATGAFLLEPLPPATYEVVASLEGFREFVSAPLALHPGGRLVIAIELEVARHVESITVGAAPNPVEVGEFSNTLASELVDVLPTGDNALPQLARLVPGVVAAPDGRVAVKGARATQVGLQLDDATILDPTTGNIGIELPVTAIATADVITRPVSSQDGRFTAALIAIDSRRAGDTWRASASNLLPALDFHDGTTHGIRSFAPRFSVGGPLVAGRLALFEALQLQAQRSRVPSLPDGENETVRRRLSSFTRMDATLGAGQRVTTSLAVFPQQYDHLFLGTFSPEAVSPNLDERGYHARVAHQWVRKASGVLESFVSVKHYRIGIFGEGRSGYGLYPDRREGSYFNRHDRSTRTVQFKQAWASALRGSHLVSAGLDVLHASDAGTSESDAVRVHAREGRLLQRIEFDGPATWRTSAVNAALFVQDVWRLGPALVVEPSLRLERDGTVGRLALAPRLGAAWALGDWSVRATVGVLHEQTPLLAGSFESREQRRIETLEGASAGVITLRHRLADDLRTASARVWSLGLERRAGPWVLQGSVLSRAGRQELIVDPDTASPDAVLWLSSRGRSSYRELETSARYQRRGRVLALSYVRATTRADSNAADLFFGNFRAPIITANEYGRADLDVPHRAVAWGVLPLPRTWVLAPVVELRSGTPYTAVDQWQQPVGPRNEGGRLPRFATLDLALSRSLSIRGRRVRVGFSVEHLLHNFTPRDVQVNVDSGAFGSLSNPLPRRFHATLQWER